MMHTPKILRIKVFAIPAPPRGFFPSAGKQLFFFHSRYNRLNEYFNFLRDDHDKYVE